MQKCSKSKVLETSSQVRNTLRVYQHCHFKPNAWKYHGTRVAKAWKVSGNFGKFPWKVLGTLKGVEILGNLGEFSIFDYFVNQNYFFFYNITIYKVIINWQIVYFNPLVFNIFIFILWIRSLPNISMMSGDVLLVGINFLVLQWAPIYITTDCEICFVLMSYFYMATKSSYCKEMSLEWPSTKFAGERKWHSDVRPGLDFSPGG